MAALDVAAWGAAWALGSYAVACVLALRRAAAFSARGARRALGARQLLVVSHPDDEAMFFAPTLAACAEARLVPTVLCLSNGDAFGQGVTREKELARSCASLGVGADRVRVVHARELSDGMGEAWPAEAVAAAVRAEVARTRATSVVTFDKGGASGHPNHVATWRGCVELTRAAATRGQPPPVPVWALRTLRPYRRLLGPADAALAAVLAFARGAMRGQAAELLLAPRGAAAAARTAMAEHRSQTTWYRGAFMQLAAYVHMNALARVAPSTARKPVHRRSKSYT